MYCMGVKYRQRLVLLVMTSKRIGNVGSSVSFMATISPVQKLSLEVRPLMRCLLRYACCVATDIWVTGHTPHRGLFLGDIFVS